MRVERPSKSTGSGHGTTAHSRGRRPRGLPRLGVLAVAAALAAGTAPRAGAQQEGDPERNLAYFPEEISRRELVGHMRDFAFGLGVACTHCHGTEEQTGFDLSGVDFSLDLKPAKGKARAMLRMTDEINQRLLARIPDRRAPDLRITCFTCHGGLSVPEAIEDRLMRILGAEGVEAAIEDYREQRSEHHGSAAYNFGEQPLVEVAADLLRGGNPAAALAVSRLNLEFHPDSGQSKFEAAQAHVELGQKDEARALVLELLEGRPDDRRLKALLESLDSEA